MPAASSPLETVEVRLPVDVWEKLRSEAARRGTDTDTVLAEAAREKVARLEQHPHAGMTFRALLAPLGEDFAATGMSEEELGELIDAEIEAHRAEKAAVLTDSNAGA